MSRDTTLAGLPPVKSHTFNILSADTVVKQFGISELNAIPKNKK